MTNQLRGVVLAAGGGTRLRPLTNTLPKTLLAVTTDGMSVLERAIANLAAVGITDITVVTGHAAEAIEALVDEFEHTYQVSLSLRFNDRYADWNNAYSLWLVADVFADGAIIVNGDTVHPVSVEQRLLAARGQAPIVLAIDDHKTLGDEEMKVQLTDDQLVTITKQMSAADADGEYIGVALIDGADAFADALQATFERDPNLYYEDGFQEFVDRGGTIAGVSIGPDVAWIEIDTHDDLAQVQRITEGG